MLSRILNQPRGSVDPGLCAGSSSQLVPAANLLAIGHAERGLPAGLAIRRVREHGGVDSEQAFC